MIPKVCQKVWGFISNPLHQAVKRYRSVTGLDRPIPLHIISFGDGSSGRNLVFFAGGFATTNEAMRITSAVKIKQLLL